MKRILWGLFCIFALTNCSRTAGVGEIKTGMNFVSVAGGTFTMGSDEEKPVHRVTVTGFRMGATEVTQAQWQAVMGRNPSKNTGRANSAECPVENISWYDAVNFCNALSLKEGLSPAYAVTGASVGLNPQATGYRLPTEAEWEYAARGGAKPAGTLYAGGDDIAAVAWYEANSGGITHPVGTKAANSLGLYDMSGNVWEWCWDWLENYDSAPQTDPVGAASGRCRIPRGGGWYADESQCTTAVRYCYKPNSVNFGIGFRVVLP